MEESNGTASSPPSSSSPKIIDYPPKDSLCGLRVRSFRFGTVKAIGTQEMSFFVTKSGLYFYAKEDDEKSIQSNGAGSSYARPPIHAEPKRRESFSWNIHMSWRHIRQVEHLQSSRLFVIFVLISGNASKQLRTSFGIREGAAQNDLNVPYFDADSSMEFHRFITVIMDEEKNTVGPLDDAIRFLLQGTDYRHVEFRPVPYSEANYKLIKTMAPGWASTMSNGGCKFKRTIDCNPLTQNSNQHQRPNNNKRVLGVGATLSLLQNTMPSTPPPPQPPCELFQLLPPGRTIVTRNSVVTLAKVIPVQAGIRRIVQPVTRIFIPTTPIVVEKSSIAKKEPKHLFDYGKVHIFDTDVGCLETGEFLNDTIIDFYLEYLVNALPLEQRKRVHLFSTFFWKRLTMPAAVVRNASKLVDGEDLTYARMKGWTKNVDLFQKDFIIIPINQDAHWYLAIVCYPDLDEPVYADEGGENGNGTEVKIEAQEPAASNDEPTSISTNDSAKTIPLVPSSTGTSDHQEYSVYDDEYEASQNLAPPAKKQCLPATKNRPILKHPFVVLLDSLVVDKPNYKATKVIRDYLVSEWASRKSDQPPRQFAMKSLYPVLPQQDNWSDCGVFLLEYVERFLFNGLLTEREDDTDLTKKTIVGQEFWNWITPGTGKGRLEMNGWFPADRIKKKRGELKILLNKLAMEWKPKRPVKKEEPDDDTGRTSLESPKSDDVIVVSQETATTFR